MSINWEKIEKKPTKGIKIQGARLLELRDQVEKRDGRILELNAKIESSSRELQNKLAERDAELEKLNREIESYNSQLNELLGELTSKDAEIEELKEQIPKKPVYAKADTVVKGAGCPKCGWTTLEEYKIVDGKKQLIRKHCPNTFCLWTSAETPTVKIAMTKEAPDEEVQPARIFKVVKGELEETPVLESAFVAILADPEQNTVWIWKGKFSDRFEYAEATRHAATAKANLMKKANARIIRVDEGEEPENFPIKGQEIGEEPENLPESL